MGTRALIGYSDTNGDTRLTSTYNHYARLTSTYNHYDGYPGNLGKGLETFYNSDAKAEEIANVGYISYLDGETGEWDAKHKQNPRRNALTDDFNEAMLDIDPETGKTEAANQQDPYVTTLPDNFNEAMMEIASNIDRIGGDYGYIWDNENEEWITVENNGIRKMAEELEMNLAHLKGKFAMVPERPDQTNSHFVDNDEADEDARMNEVIIKEEGAVDKAKKALKGKMNLDVYINSLENDIRLNGEESYEDYSLEDFVEDYDNYTQNKAELDELFVRQMKFRAGIIK